MELWRKLFGLDGQRSEAPGNDAYKVYTSRFDRIVTGNNLDDVLGRLTGTEAAALEDAWQIYVNGMLQSRMELTLKGIELSRPIAEAISRTELEDTVVTILIDHSGSLKGQSILMAATAVDVAQEMLRQLGCKVEVLGFTTGSWKGGQARKMWRDRGAQDKPGRLCDLLHVVYSSADETRTSSLGHRLKPMLRADLLKENVDGEALQWASGRLRKRPEACKLIVVISDGQPFDDSTNHANGAHYLLRHLENVVGQLRRQQDIDLSAIGIGYDADKLYGRGQRVDRADQLGEALISQIHNVLMEAHASAT